MERLNLYEYEDYRAFLHDFYAFHKKRAAHAFSFRVFSERAGLKSPNYLKMVMEGKRNLSSEMIVRFAAGLRLSEREKVFFEALVRFNQAETAAERETYFTRLVKFRTRLVSSLKRAQYRYFSRWYHVVIREMIVLENFKEDPQWIAQTVVPPILAAQAKEALQVLLELGLIVRDAEGRLRQSNAHVSTDETVVAADAYHFHEHMIRQGLQALKLASEERSLSSMTMPLPRSEVARLQTRIFQFFGEIQQWLETLDCTPEEVYQLNFQLFALTRTPRDEDGGKRTCT